MTSAGIAIRIEQPGDFAATEAINAAAFEREGEAELVRRLRPREGTLSLVAIEEDAVVGHILFSLVSVDLYRGEGTPLGLGPMSVTPERQGSGIGSALVRDGLARCHELGAPFVVVLGHPDFYGRFGFVPASRFGLSCRWPVPDEVFMARELTAGRLSETGGLVRYAPEFDQL